MKTFRQIRINEEVKDSEVDLILEPGKTYILKQKAKDYKRGLLVTLTEDRDYEVAYWINDAKPYPIEMIIDGKSIKQDAKKVKMTRHPELEESITFAKHNSYVGASNTDNPLDEKLVASDISILDTILSKIKDDIMKNKLAGKFEKSWPMMQQLAKMAGFGITKKMQAKNKIYQWKLKK